LGFFLKAFGQSNVDLEAKLIRSATVELGGLSHVTIESGALVDYLLTLAPTTPCYRDLFDERNLTIVAALRAGTFAYTFQNQAGATVKFMLPEATQMFKTDASVDVQVEQFTMDARSAPSGILGYHTKNQLSQLFAYPLTAEHPSMTGEPTPIEAESGSMPAHHRFGRDDHQSPFPLGPQASGNRPKELVRPTDIGPRVPAPENHQLLAQGHVLQQQIPDEMKKDGAIIRLGA